MPNIVAIGPFLGANCYKFRCFTTNLCGLEPQLIKLEFIIYLPKLKVSRADLPALILANSLTLRAVHVKLT